MTADLPAGSNSVPGNCGRNPGPYRAPLYLFSLSPRWEEAIIPEKGVIIRSEIPIFTPENQRQYVAVFGGAIRCPERTGAGAGENAGFRGSIPAGDDNPDTEHHTLAGVG